VGLFDAKVVHMPLGRVKELLSELMLARKMESVATGPAPKAEGGVRAAL
jgi:hypothetical protein